MSSSISKMKVIMAETLGKSVSASLLERLNAILDQGVSDIDKLAESCEKVQKMLALFVAPEKASIVTKQLNEILFARRTLG